MDDLKKSKPTRFTRLAVHASCGLFGVAVTLVIIAFLISPRTILGYAGICLAPIGFLLGIIGLLGSLRSNNRFLLLASAGTVLNGLLLGPTVSYFTRPPMSAREAVIRKTNSVHEGTNSPRVSPQLKHQPTPPLPPGAGR